MIQAPSISYYRGDDCRTIDRSQLKQLLSLDNAQVGTTPGVLQCLDIFPLDVWIELFSFMDIETLTLLRSVCKNFRDIISATPKYKLLYTNVAHLIRASLISEVGSFITLDQLHQAYVSTKCSFEGCVYDPEYIYLLESTRVCAFHLHAIKLVTLSEDLCKALEDSEVLLENLPCIRPILSWQSFTLFMDRKTIDLFGQNNELIANQILQKTLSNKSREREHAWLLGSCLMVPWLDPETRSNHWGYQCDSHELESNPYTGFGFIYTRARMSKCCEDCYEARVKWKAYVFDEWDNQEEKNEKEKKGKTRKRKRRN